MDVLRKECFNAIANNDVQGFMKCLDTIKERIDTTPEKVVLLDFKWLQSVPFVCTLYNNRILINETGTQLQQYYTFKPNPCSGSEISVLDLARALNYKQCLKHLQSLYSEKANGGKSEHRADAFNVFASILRVGGHYRLDQQVIIRSLHRLVDNGFNVCDTGPRGKSIIHEAVLNTCSLEIYKTLFLLGCDVNCITDTKETALFKFIYSVYNYNSRFAEIVEIVKVFLYENPSPVLNAGIIASAISYDRRKFPDDEDVSDDDTISDNHGLYEPHKRQRKEDLRLLPWLYRAGFPISQQDRENIERRSLFCQNVTYDHVRLQDVRPLMEIARNVIRWTYPGRRLHNVINKLILPTSVKDYILMKDLVSNC